MAGMIGIDLGTTNSAVSILKDGKAVVIQDDFGVTIPSVVCVSEEEMISGYEALKLERFYPNSTVKRIKRKMGTDQHLEFFGREYTPEEISAAILKNLKNRAEVILGEIVRDVVITVPAYFNDNQRQATKIACEIAGLRVIRMVNEPTAASLAYGIREDEDLNIVVYDLGGGTFDVSLLNIGEGIFEVLATAGNNELGGEDFNARLVDTVLNKFFEETEIDLREDPLALTKVEEAVEKAKIALSEQSSVKIQVPFITADEKGVRDLDLTITRETFERLIEDYVNQTIELTREVVKDAHLNLDQVDRVILVGGSTRIPLVQSKLHELFGIAPDTSLNPEEVVAMGAAIQGGVVQGDVSGIVLVDVTPMSLGIEVEDGYFVPIIERNSPIPTSAKRVFTTVANNQRNVDVHILQGESMHAANNISLGKFRLEGVRQALKGEARIAVTLELDVNGILNVTAEDVDTKNVQGITIVNNTRVDQEEIRELKAHHEKTYRKDIQKRVLLNQVLKLKTRAENLSSRIEELVSEDSRRELLNAELQEVMEKVPTYVKKLNRDALQETVDNLEFMYHEIKSGTLDGDERIA